MLNHRNLFVFGFLYYLVLPVLVGVTGLLSDSPGFVYWFPVFRQIPINTLLTYFVVIGFFLLAYLLGSGRVQRDLRPIVPLPVSSETSLFFLAIAIGFIVFDLVVAFRYHEILFTGYSSFESARQIVGMISTVNTLLGFMTVYLLLSNSRRKLLRLYLVALFVTSVILLGLGGRLYVVIPLLALLIYKLGFAPRRMGGWRVFLLGTAIVLFMLSVGVWRVGGATSAKALSFIFFAEPVFTWWSAATFLTNNQSNLPLLEFPSNFLSSFVNFIPSYLTPDKTSMIASIADKYPFSNPLGAQSIFVSVVGNFGICLGTVFMFLVGKWFCKIERAAEASAFFRAYYILAVSVLPFQFFRDDFSLINKQLFWNLLIVPALLLFLARPWHHSTGKI